VEKKMEIQFRVREGERERERYINAMPALTALHPTTTLSLDHRCFPFQRKLRPLAILAGQDARPATPLILLNAHNRQDQLLFRKKKKVSQFFLKKKHQLKKGVSCRVVGF
jgi:hypothetical protein